MKMSRKPRRSELPHVVTIWNKLPMDMSKPPINGSYGESWQKTVIRYVRYTFKAAAVAHTSGNTSNDSLFLMIFEGVSASEERRYATPEMFRNASDDERREMWTIQPGEDYIGLGEIEDSFPKTDKNGRNDYKATICDCKYGAAAEIHHYEVYAE